MIIDHCSWNAPGADPYQGETAAAVYAYSDIPRNVQDALADRMMRRQFDDVATIGRDTISGSHEYTGLREMHFGKRKVCRSVDRSGWAPGAQEVGLVYCEAEHCLIVPTVCRNVSRVTRTPAPVYAEPDPPAASAMPSGGGPPSTYTQTFAAPEPAVPPLVQGQAFLPAAWAMPPQWSGAPPVVAPTSPVPDAPGWAQALAGLAALAILWLRRVWP